MIVSASVSREEHFMLRNKFFRAAIDRRINEVERRISALEQPLWKISSGGTSSWNTCSEGNLCRCSIKSLSCWNMNLRAIPLVQIVPNDVLSL